MDKERDHPGESNDGECRSPGELREHPDESEDGARRTPVTAATSTRNGRDGHPGVLAYNFPPHKLSEDCRMGWDGFRFSVLFVVASKGQGLISGGDSYYTGTVLSTESGSDPG